MCPDSIKPVGVRDIYALEFQLFQNMMWVGFYCFSVCVFMFHACVGWKKVISALGIPKLHHKNVTWIGYVIFVVIGTVYLSFPLFCVLTNSYQGEETALQVPKPNANGPVRLGA